MNTYEVLYIIKPELEDEQKNAVVAKFSDLVTANGGEVEGIDEWGKRRFAYPINYVNEGYYVLMNFKSKPDFPVELERNFRITEDIMRFMVTKREA